MPAPTALPRGLSMLWEDADAPAALRDRFGFADMAEVEGFLHRQLGARWGVTVVGCTRLVISDRAAVAWVRTDEGAGDLVVKWTAPRDAAHAARLAATAGLLGRLGERGLPVVVPLADREGHRRVVVDGPAGPLSLGVSPEVRAPWIDPDDLPAVRDAGRVLARLHAALDDEDPAPWATGTELPSLQERVAGWLDRHDPGHAPRASERLRGLIEGLPEPTAAPGLVHRDYRGANLLVEGSRVVAVLDLDETTTDHRVQDLAQSAAFLATRFTAWGPTTGATRDALRRGYEEVRPLTPVEVRWGEALGLWMMLTQVPAGPDPQGWGPAVDGRSPGLR